MNFRRSSSSSVTSHNHTDWRGRRCSPNEYWQLCVLNSNSINLYIFSHFPNGNGTQNSLHLRCSHLFVCQTKPTLIFFCWSITHVHCCASFVLIGWMWIYVTRRNCSCFSLPLHGRRSERITLGIWFGQLTCRSAHTSIATTSSQTTKFCRSQYLITVFFFSFCLAENRNSLNNYVRIDAMLNIDSERFLYAKIK